MCHVLIEYMHAHLHKFTNSRADNEVITRPTPTQVAFNIGMLPMIDQPYNSKMCYTLIHQF